MVCAGDDVRCVAGEARAGAMAGGVAVAADEPSDVVAVILQLQPPQVIMLWFPGCSLLLKRDSDMPVTVSIILR